MHNVVYSNQAQIDIDDAISHIAIDNKKNAFNYLARYIEKVELLRLNPYMGVECQNKLIKRECRVLVHESHLIIYKVLEETSEIYLIRIFHASVDYAKKVNNESSI